MRSPAFGTNMAIFSLFFGLAAIDAIAVRAWWQVTFWLAIAMVFVSVDLSRHRTRSDSSSQ